MTLQANISDAALQYDKYYEGGKDSIYNKRFGKKRVTLRESSILKKTISNLIKNLVIKETNTKQIEFKILDFGCGDGRLFEVIQEIAANKNTIGIKFKFTGYDISRTGLEEFRNILIDNKFHEIEESADNNELNITNFSKLKKDNIEVSLIHSSISNFDEIKLYIGQGFNLIMCMFGVLSHIPKRENRTNLLKMFNESLSIDGQTIISVPTVAKFQNEQKLYVDLRKEYADNKGCLASKLGLATEPGDLYYQVIKDNKIITNFYHIYDSGELYCDLKRTDFKIEAYGVYCTKHITAVTKNSIINCLDNLLAQILSSKIFPSKFKERMVQYLVFIAGNNQKI